MKIIQYNNSSLMNAVTFFQSWEWFQFYSNSNYMEWLIMAEEVVVLLRDILEESSVAREKVLEGSRIWVWVGILFLEWLPIFPELGVVQACIAWYCTVLAILTAVFSNLDILLLMVFHAKLYIVFCGAVTFLKKVMSRIAK